MVFCGASTQNGLGEFSIIRAISGKENFYILRKSWRTEPFSTDDGAPVDMESVRALAVTNFPPTLAEGR